MSRPVFGWEAEVALPGLGLGALLAKVDTGARTSALHAVEIAPFGPADRPMLRFVVHPLPGRPELAVECRAPLAGRRAVRSSNGQAEVRYVVRTPLVIGGLEREAEVSLADRGAMTYRLLLGRTALAAFDALVDPARGLG